MSEEEKLREEEYPERSGCLIVFIYLVIITIAAIIIL